MDDLKGKRAIIKAFDKNPNLLRRMKELNNCIIVGTLGCSSCHIPKFARCWEKVRRELQREAFLKFRNTPQFKKEQERLENEIKK